MRPSSIRYPCVGAVRRRYVVVHPDVGFDVDGMVVFHRHVYWGQGPGNVDWS
jgi:hypothetical protein